MDPYRQSAVIPVKVIEGRLHVLMITTVGGGRWVVPKGIIEDRMSPQESARKEAIEEAGVTGNVRPKPVGEYTYEKWNDTCHVTVYLMLVDEVLDVWPEQQVRRREWVLPEEAARRAREPGLSGMLREIEETVRRLGA